MFYNCVLVRFSGEFGVKSLQTQELIGKLLETNIKNALKAEGKSDLLARLKIVSRQARYYFIPEREAESDIETLISTLGRTFGVSSVSPCFRASLNDATTVRTIPAKLMLVNSLFPSRVEIKVIGKAGVDEKAWRDDIYSLCKKFEREGSRVSTRRFDVNKNWDTAPWLSSREKKLEIEVFEGYAYITVERIKAPGGFPLGLEDPLVALVSGGIDSPVAAWMAMRRGAPLIMVVMDSADGAKRSPSKGASVKEKALREVQILLEYMKGYSEEVKVFLIPYGKYLSELSKAGGSAGVTCLLCKRFMYRVAEIIALACGAKGIITGEILGEQASQTSQNLMVLDSVVNLPVYRPLFGFDKEEVLDKARMIGTEKIVSLSQAACWAVPSHPQIRANASTVEKAEQKANIEELVKECVSNAKQLTPKDVDAFLAQR